MLKQNWVYLGQLVRALQLEAVDGRRIGEMVAEIEQHLADSGADPVDEFGPPPMLARELADRPGSRRPGWVPPLWLTQLGSFVLLLLAMPLVAPYEWQAGTIPYTRGALSYAIVFYLGVFWIGYAANRKLDGRSWRALTGGRFFLAILALAAVVTLLLDVGNESTLLALPKIPYLLFCALAIPALLFVMIRKGNPVRFPEHAQHLNRLKRGPLAGAPPASRRA